MSQLNGNAIVPTIDISAIDSVELEALDAACRNHGFFLLSGHGLDALIETTWCHARAFFDADQAVKRAIMRDLSNPMGWYDRELTKGCRDHKEIFDFTYPGSSLGISRNQWPSQPPGFKQAMTEFYEAFSALAVETTHLVHRALGLAESESAELRGDPTVSPVRLNNYLLGDPVPASERAGLVELGDTALGEHTDPGVLTLLLQDNVGGLQAQTAAGEWVDVTPTPGTVVVNVGDMMQVWTNDRYKAAMHRVLPMTDKDRMSIPYFFHPPRDAMIQPISRLADSNPHYRSFSWAGYIKARDDDNFDNLGQNDSQISDYRI